MKVRLELIRHKAIASMLTLKVRVPWFVCCLAHVCLCMQATSAAMHQEMDQWVKTCYNQEIERCMAYRVETLVLAPPTPSVV